MGLNLLAFFSTLKVSLRGSLSGRKLVFIRERFCFNAFKQVVLSKRVYRKSLNLHAALFMSILVRVSCILNFNAERTFYLRFYIRYASTVRMEAKWLVYILRNSLKPVNTRCFKNLFAKDKACTYSLRSRLLETTSYYIARIVTRFSPFSCVLLSLSRHLASILFLLASLVN